MAVFSIGQLCVCFLPIVLTPFGQGSASILAAMAVSLLPGMSCSVTDRVALQADYWGVDLNRLQRIDTAKIRVQRLSLAPIYQLDLFAAVLAEHCVFDSFLATCGSLALLSGSSMLGLWLCGEDKV